MNTKNLQRCVIASLFAVSALSVHAAPIVSWGNSTGYVTGTANFTNVSGQTSGDYWRNGAPGEVTPNAGYSAPSGKTEDIFAVFQQQTVAATKTFAALNIADDAAGDFIRMTGQNNSTLSGLIYFTKTGFLNGYNSGTLSMGQVDEMSWTLAGNNSADTTSIRLAVLNGTQWYVSSANSTSNAAGTVAFDNLASTTWGTWNPSSFPLDAAFGTFGTPSLTDVQAFGMYFTTTRSSQTRLNISGFEVIAIPEPGTLALVGIAPGSLLLFRRKR